MNVVLTKREAKSNLHALYLACEWALVDIDAHTPTYKDCADLRKVRRNAAKGILRFADAHKKMAKAVGFGFRDLDVAVKIALQVLAEKSRVKH